MAAYAAYTPPSLTLSITAMPLTPATGVDAFNERVHVFDATAMPPKYATSVKLREQPGWITFSLDGKYAYPSTGEIIDVASKKILTALTDETSRDVHSEKMVEIHWKSGKVVKTGDQFGVGRVTK